MSPPAYMVGGVFHPWGILRALVHVRLSFVVMPDGKPGRTNGRDRIWLDKHLQQTARRCTLTHELVHLEYGHDSCQSPAVERIVRAETARRLIPLDHLAKGLAWTTWLEELAEELWVTPEVLSDRMDNLSPAEKAFLDELEKQL